LGGGGGIAFFTSTDRGSFFVAGCLTDGPWWALLVALSSGRRYEKPVARSVLVGLSYLKHIHDQSDEAVCDRWRENPYSQFLCGNEYFEHDLPCDPSSRARSPRNRIGPTGMEKLLAATLEAGLASGTVKVSSDTTVQPKAIAHPTDSQLYLKAIRALVRHAKRHGVTLRQAHSYRLRAEFPGRSASGTPKSPSFCTGSRAGCSSIF
jgi:hypothetical protein